MCTPDEDSNSGAEVDEEWESDEYGRCGEEEGEGDEEEAEGGGMDAYGVGARGRAVWGAGGEAGLDGQSGVAQQGAVNKGGLPGCSAGE